MNPLEIPLETPLGKAPSLGHDLGHLSFSHCNDALLLGWSPNQLGVDIERSDRTFASHRLASRFFSQDDHNELTHLDPESFRIRVLEKWIIKEALIKWQNGSLASDLREWVINQEANLAIHKCYDYQVKVYTIKYKKWIISIASNQELNRKNLIICAQ